MDVHPPQNGAIGSAPWPCSLLQNAWQRGKVYDSESGSCVGITREAAVDRLFMKT